MLRLPALAALLLGAGAATLGEVRDDDGGGNELKPGRDPNALWNKGGLMYPIPFR